MKKDSLASLVNSLVSPNEEERETQEQAAAAQETTDLTSEEVEEFGTTPEMQAAINELRRKKVGRPKGSGRKAPKPREARATFIVEPTIIKKFKYIALAETRLYKDVIKEAFSRYIEAWEEENGEITLPKKRR